MIPFTPCERCTIVRPAKAKHGWYTGVRVIFCGEATDQQLSDRLTYIKQQEEQERQRPVAALPEAKVNVPPDVLREVGVSEEQVKIIHDGTSPTGPT